MMPGLGPAALLVFVLLFSAACDDTVDPNGGGVPLIEPVAAIPIPPNYGVHDIFVRDGLAFVAAWNSGLMIYDVGAGVAGGTPARPMLVSEIIPSAGELSGARTHNAWWFHNPVTDERRYVFLGQEGPGALGASASGDLRVIDVSDLSNPVEVAFYRLEGAGSHNFWMDEAAQVLYAAFYNGGVIAFDVSGTLTGDLADRVLFRERPGGDDTYVWGVMLHRGDLYAIDMLDGLYRLSLSGPTSPPLESAAGVVDERYSSDLWLHGDWGFTGTWGNRAAPGNAVKVWRLTDEGPVPGATLVIGNIGTVGDLEVSRDGGLLLVAAERGANAGIHLFDVTAPDDPDYVARHAFREGAHTATFGYVDGRTYVFAAKNPGSPAVLIYDVRR